MTKVRITKPITDEPQQAPNIRLAIAYAIGAFAFWTVGDTFNKVLGLAGIPSYQMLGISAVFGTLTIFIISALNGNARKLRPKKLRRLLIFGISQPLNYCVVVMALKHLPLASFYAICFASPFCVALGAAVFFREKLDIHKILAIVLGFVGVLIAINPSDFLDNSNDRIGVLATSFSTLVFTFQSLYMRHLGRKETQEATAFIPRFIAAIGGVGAIVLLGRAPMEPHQFIYSACSGIAGGLGWLGVASAYKNGPAATVAPFHYTQIIVGVILGYIIWHDVPAPHVVIGTVLIILSGLYIVLHARKTSVLVKDVAAQENI